MSEKRQPWLGSSMRESLFILAPSIVPVIFVLLFKDYFTTSDVSTFWWVLLVLCIDVSHVYSTLFRLYWDRETFRTYQRLLIIIPVAGFIVGFMIHNYDAFLFWRLLAYVAVFHFVRQQYGFLRLYSRTEARRRMTRLIDGIAIYNATIYPIVFWHVYATDKLAWFVKGDFIRINAGEYFSYITAMYILIIVVYVVKEVWLSWTNGFFNIPKNMIVVGTYLSWYVGIVLFQGDLIFTLLNVVAHGIPYMALIWMHGERKASPSFSFNVKGVAVFISVLLVLAYVEEFLWDGFIWKDHPEIFPFLADVSVDQPVVLSVIVAVLVLPQVTHYILDGFIWRFSKDVRARM